MFVRITSHPPLGHEFIVPHSQDNTTFNVLIETEADPGSLEVQVWHNFTSSSSWEALPLPASSTARLSIIQSDHSLHRSWFQGTLKGRPSQLHPVSFTIRFRAGPNEGWKWAHDQSGIDDGQLLWQAPLKSISERKDLSYYVDGLSKDVKVENLRSDTPNTNLWSLTAPAHGARGEESGWTTHRFGLPSDYVRWFAVVRLWSPWLAPRQGKGSKLAERDGILYSFMRRDGLHVAVLAISGIGDVMTLLKAGHDYLDIIARNDREEEGVARLVAAVGGTVEEAIAACMYSARKLVMGHVILTKEEREPIDILKKVEEDKQSQEDGVKANWVQDWYDGFTFCTWNALGQNLTEEKISGALRSLEENGIKITNLIIDDNWQSLDHEGEGQMARGWTDFEANPKGFPEGLKNAVGKIRHKYPDIQHIAVWHALLGYWGGISPSGRLAKSYKTREVALTSDFTKDNILVVDQPDVKKMYEHFYTFLNSCKIDAVKTDAQFFLDLLASASARRDLINTYLNTWVSAQLRHFGGLAISCMSQSPAILFRCQLPNDLPATPVRISDDFFPNVEASHPWHIFCNAHNAIFTKHLNILPDWDMFQTHQKWGPFHAAARCLSGGPIYITDEPGKHDVGLIRQMTATTIRGQTVILRPSIFGRSMQAYIGFEEERLVKVGAYHGHSGTGTGFLGFFNCRREGVTEVVSVSEFLGVEDMKEGCVIRSHRTGICSGVLSATDDDVLAIQVDGYEWEVLSASPVHCAKELAGLCVADLGILGKMTGGAGIIETRYSVRLGYDDGHADGNGHANGNGHGSGNGNAIAYDANGSLSARAQPDQEDHVTDAQLDTKAAGRHSLVVKTVLKALGTWGVWVQLGEPREHRETRGGLDLDEDVMVLVEGRAVPRECVRLVDAAATSGEGEGEGKPGKKDHEAVVLEVDVERAWKELGLQPWWSNEVGVAVYLWV